MLNYKVSVIVPIYNKEKYIDKTLSSLSSQSYVNCEFILIDDCSSDSSLKICKKWIDLDDRFKLIKNRENLGAAESRNVGLKIATGEYVCFVDADDIVDKDMFSYLIGNCSCEDVLMCGASSIDENDVTIKKMNNVFSNDGRYNGIEFWCGFQWMLSSALWNKMIKLEKIKKNNILFHDIKGPEDLLFIYDVIKSDTSIFYTTHTFYYYRIAQISLSKSFGVAEEINDIDILLTISEYLISNNCIKYNNAIRIALLKYYDVYYKLKKNKNNEYDQKLDELFSKITNQLKKMKVPLGCKIDILRMKIRSSRK